MTVKMIPSIKANWAIRLVVCSIQFAFGSFLSYTLANIDINTMPMKVMINSSS